MQQSRRQQESSSHVSLQFGIFEKTDEQESYVRIASLSDVVLARESARELAQRMGFSSMTIGFIVTAVSEIAHNVAKYAETGKMTLREMIRGDRRGLFINVSDRGPGIPDIELAMQKGYSTSQGLGLGLPGCRRLMDEFDIQSQVGTGTSITMVKWL
jgi:serine/threonine-protein kinase RsbT